MKIIRKIIFFMLFIACVSCAKDDVQVDIKTEEEEKDYTLQPVDVPYLKGNWKKVNTDFKGVNRNASIPSFSINDKCYFGLGYSSEHGFVSDVWEFDPKSNQWTEKTSFSGETRYSPIYFVANNKFYYGYGWNPDTNQYLNDLWEFDPETNIWKQLPNGKPEKRDDAFVFVIGEKVYLGAGFIILDDSTQINTDIMLETFATQENGYVSYYKDLWEFDVISGTWNRKNNLPSSITQFQFDDYRGFSGDSNGYIINRQGSIWQYDNYLDKWTTRSSPSIYSSDGLCLATWLWHSASASAVMNTLDNKLYVVSHNIGAMCDEKLSGYWEYDIQNDSWQQIAEPSLEPTMIRFGSICSANNKLFLLQADYISLEAEVTETTTGTSIHHHRESTRELWELDPNQ